MNDSGNSTPSLLGHPRFQTPDAPVGTSNPLKYFDQTLASEKDTLSNESQLSEFGQQFLGLQKPIHKEKLNVSRKNALLLSAVARDARKEHTDINWDSFLPSLFRNKDLKTTVPTFETYHEASPLLTEQAGLQRPGMESPVQREGFPSAPKGFGSHVESIIGKLKNEKLSCSKESLVLIQNARKRDAYQNDTAVCFDPTIRPFQKTYEPYTSLSPMNSTQFYSPPPSPKSRISLDPHYKTREESNTRKYQCRPKTLPQEAQENSTPSSPFTALGSLAAFMETRGKVCGRRLNTKSPYFAGEGNILRASNR